MLRRDFLTGCSGLAAGAFLPNSLRAAELQRKAQIAITLDLEMSRHYPKRGMTEWDYKKGELDEATKRYAVEASRVAHDRGAVIHFFCVGRVLEQADVGWLRKIAEAGHPVGNHTYDHVNVHAKTMDAIQFRFKRAPWLIEGRSISDVIRDNVAVTTKALQLRAGIEANGFRTPGGFYQGIEGRADLQRMLLEQGFTWISSKYPQHEYGKVGQEPTSDVYASIVAAQAAAQPSAYSSGLIEVPMSPISDVGAFRSTRWKLEWFLEAIRRSVDWAIKERRVFDFLAHPSCMVVEDPEFETIKLICDQVKQASDTAEIVGLDKIAATVSA
ncbi:MAG: chitin deacetylase [Planctomycetaceae bacterium]|nr:chitin deacetylase [Planctomycetaceae bacterium]